jgi:hypothetical protein
MSRDKIICLLSNIIDECLRRKNDPDSDTLREAALKAIEDYSKANGQFLNQLGIVFRGLVNCGINIGFSDQEDEL